MNRSPLALALEASTSVTSGDAERRATGVRRTTDPCRHDAGSDVRQSLRHVASSFQRVAARMRALVVPSAHDLGPSDESDPLGGCTTAGTWIGPIHHRRLAGLK